MKQYPYIESDISEGFMDGGYILRLGPGDNWHWISRNSMERLINQCSKIHIGQFPEEGKLESNS